MGSKFFNIKKKANKLLLDLNINSYPIDLFEIVNNIDNCILVTYTDYASRLGIDIYEASKQLGSEDATVITKGDNCIIFYNDTIEVKQRIRWSIAHEIGHIILGHINDYDCSLSRGLSNEKYNIYEQDSNHFASELLSNLSVLHELGVNSHVDISKICDISLQAAKSRFAKYQKWIKNEYKSYEDKILCTRFSNNSGSDINKHDEIIKINSSKSESILLFGFCKNCGCKYEISDYQPNFCGICGKSFKFKLEGDLTMIYNGHELDNRGRAIVCPICENEEKGNGPYCFICGTFIINRCSDETCGQIALGNARYCEHCGEPTTFFVNKLLTKFDDVSNLALSDDIPF